MSQLKTCRNDLLTVRRLGVDLAGGYLQYSHMTGAVLAGESDMSGMQDELAEFGAYDVIRPLADGKGYWLIGRALSLGDAKELAAFHRQNDRKYTGGGVIVRPNRTRSASVGGAA